MSTITAVPTTTLVPTAAPTPPPTPAPGCQVVPINPSTVPAAKDLFLVGIYGSAEVSSQLSRATQYSWSNKGLVAIKVLETTGETALVCAMLGGAIGGLAGGISGGPVGIAPGAVKGAAIGGAVGVALGTTYAIYEIRSSPHYRNWLKETRNSQLSPIYKKFLAENDLEICPLSADVISIPVRCKHGICFEHSEVERYIQLQPQKNEFPCPGGANHPDPDSMSSFSYDDTYHDRLFAKLKNISIQNPVIKAGVEAYRKGVRENNANLAAEIIKKEIAEPKENQNPDSLKARLCAIVDNLCNKDY